MESSKCMGAAAGGVVEPRTHSKRGGRGVIAARRSALYIDELNLLDDGLSKILLEVISSGIVRIERESLSIMPARHQHIQVLAHGGGICIAGRGRVGVVGGVAG